MILLNFGPRLFLNFGLDRFKDFALCFKFIEDFDKLRENLMGNLFTDELLKGKNGYQFKVCSFIYVTLSLPELLP